MADLRLTMQRLQHLCARSAEEHVTQHETTMILDEITAEFERYRNLLTMEMDCNPESELIDGFNAVQSDYDAARQHLMGRFPVIVQVDDAGPRAAETTNSDRIPNLSRILEQQQTLMEALVNRQPAFHANRAAVKLPDINIPKFNGNAKAWPAFDDLFESTIHQNQALTDVQRFQYLRSFLVGQAALTITGIAITADNYNIAREKLKKKYNRPATITRAIIDSFLTCESVAANLTNFHSVTGLFSETIALLDSQGEYEQSRDPWVIHLMLEKLDRVTKDKWAERTHANGSPSLAEFLEFLEERSITIDSSKGEQTTKSIPKSGESKRHGGIHLNSVSPSSCIYCQGQHHIAHCKSFLALSIEFREKFISNDSRCYNCFGKWHSVRTCRSKLACNVCNKRHHTTLHKPVSESKGIGTSPSIPENDRTKAEVPQSIQINASYNPKCSKILPTAVVAVQDRFGVHHSARLLLDTGAQSNFVTDKLVTILQLKRDQSTVPISRVADQGNSTIYSKGRVRLLIRSRSNCHQKVELTAHILPTLTENLPQASVQLRAPEYISSKFELADPEFNVSAPIDIILGASLFFSCLKSGLHLCVQDKLYLQNTIFGFIACSDQENVSQSISLNTISTCEDSNLHDLVESFWKQEEPTISPPIMTVDEQACEKRYRETTYRLPSGRFCTRLPLNQKVEKLGESYPQALRRFHALERKFKQNEQFRTEYTQFMNDYEALGHMRQIAISPNQLVPGKHFVIPHHGIQQKKLRVVFDASAKSSTGVSLNDCLYPGRALQNTIDNVINYFRSHRFVMTADIEKMYRQIEIHQDDQLYQMIVWRPSPVSAIRLYQLTTVTYGENCSPFLALRTINELVNQDGFKYPLALEAISEGRYIDDVFFGADDLDQLNAVKTEMIELLQGGKFQLRKWAANEPSSLRTLDSRDLIEPLLFDTEGTSVVRTLGIIWSPRFGDVFSYQFTPQEISIWSKRQLLSDMARLYDPLGWITPVTLTLKSILQRSWVRKINWDDPLPVDMITEWESVRNGLSKLDQVRIPRYFGSRSFEVHGFCDASKTAYAAAIYVKAIDDEGNVRTQLVIAKSKLAPIRPMTIPRLELCGALLLARLTRSIMDGPLSTLVSKTVLWSDSSIVLSWLKSCPREHEIFVSNRIGKIMELCPNVTWAYVNTKNNPADIASRGATPLQLLAANIWWFGPSFLRSKDVLCHFRPAPPTESPEQPQTDQISTVTVNRNEWMDIIERFSNVNRAIRSFTYMFRFISRCRKQQEKSLPLLAEDLDRALNFIVRQVQQVHFIEELDQLKKNLPIHKRSHIRTLSPFIDNNGLLRLGGRLIHAADENFNPQPILLPNSHLAKIIVRNEHLTSLHGGPKVVAYRVRMKFWIVGLAKLVKSVCSNCARCVRYRAKTFTPTMGNLPEFRVKPSKPFAITGIDFAGPILLRPTRSRGKTTTKGYIALMVCSVTRAVHLELIMSLSVESLIMGLHRFIARRGRVEQICSDNGRNFVGCGNALDLFRSKIAESLDDNDLKNFFSMQQITWSYIPPYAPHFGGLWESGVKSVKGHLQRAFHTTTLTIEEIETALCRIEAILNSRPLSPLSFSEPYVPICPSHLLNGEGTSQFPDLQSEMKLSSVVTMRRQVIQTMVNGFWHKWRTEYLDSIMRKPKWLHPSKDPCVGDLVFIKRSNDPPRFWLIGKIEATHPGTDKVTRVVTVRTAQGIRREATRSLIPMKINSTELIGGEC